MRPYLWTHLAADLEYSRATFNPRACLTKGVHPATLWTHFLRILDMDLGKNSTFQVKVLLSLVIVHSPSRVQLFATPWTAAHQFSLSPTISWSLPKFMSIALVMPSNHLILCHPLLLPSIFPSLRVFCSELALCIRWLKYWSFSFNINPSNEYSGLTSFKIDWFDLLAAQGTLKSLF